MFQIGIDGLGFSHYWSQIQIHKCTWQNVVHHDNERARLFKNVLLLLCGVRALCMWVGLGADPSTFVQLQWLTSGPQAGMAISLAPSHVA